MRTKSKALALWLALSLLAAVVDGCAASPAVLVEAEAFENHGGWTLEGQFFDQIGSSYLLAHGLGKPVANARTTVELPRGGAYRVWVRTKDWVPGHHPGTFKLHINGQALETVFGADDRDWHWHDAGLVDLPGGAVELELEDLTGFDGRCDAIFLTMDSSAPPEGNTVETRAWRRRMLGHPENPPDAGAFDVVVVGGGVPGSAAALTAARLGCRVALVQNRPVLGGNASREVGILPRGKQSNLTKELVARGEDGDILAEQVLRENGNITLFLDWHAYRAEQDGDRIVAVIARNNRTTRELRFAAPVFIDTTGRAAVGLLVGAATLEGREARSEYNEVLAPETRDTMHHGHTIMFHTQMRDHPVEFPDVPWALEVAGDFANLGGQTVAPGRENVPGPYLGEEGPNAHWTHFWEYGQYMDTYRDFEKIRDHLFRALYGTFSNVKKRGGTPYMNLDLAWVSPVLATGGWKRLEGEYVLSLRDLRPETQHHDAVAINSGALCLHYPGEEYDFRLGDWRFIGIEPFQVPFRALFSKNIDNLMMAGKHISSTHVAAAATKFMLNGAQCGIAVGAAAYLCNKYKTTPRGVYENHLAELQDIIAQRGEYDEALRNPNPIYRRR